MRLPRQSASCEAIRLSGGRWFRAAFLLAAFLAMALAGRVSAQDTNALQQTNITETLNSASPTNAAATNVVATQLTPTNAPPIPVPTSGWSSTNQGYQSYPPQVQSAIAQVSAIAPNPTIGTGQISPPLMGHSALAGPALTPPGVSGAAVSPVSIAHWGPIDVHGQITDTLSYGNGLQASPGHSSDTLVDTFSPGLTIYAGSHWILSYTPTFSFYSSSAFQNTTGQNVLLTGFTDYQDWEFTLLQSYTASTQPLIETAAETSQEGYATSLGGTRQLGNSFSLQLNLGQNFRLAQAYANDYEWTAGTWLNYHPIQQFSFGVGVNGTYDAISDSPDMASQSYQGNIQFAPGPKLTIALTGGLSVSEFVNSPAPNLIEPVYSGSITYQATESTSLSVNAARSVTPAFFSDQVTVSTQMGASIRQRLLGTVYLTVAGGYSSTPYTSITPEALPAFWIGAPPTGYLQNVRNDTTTYISVTLSAVLANRINGSLFFSKTDNASGQANFAYSTVQEGLSLSYSF